jgi:ABC-2 type transport system ATP-binding protein
VLDEVARIGSRVLVIARGRLAAAGDYRDLRERMDDRPLRIRVVCEHSRRLGAVLLDRGAVDAASVDGDGVVIDTRDSDVFGRVIAPTAKELGIVLREVAPLDDDLESVFRYLVEGR